MRLRTYESFWLIKNGLLYTYPSLQKNISTEIIVLGGGITGALMSHRMVQEGYETLLLDKRDIAMGSTSANTSMLQYEIDVPLYKLAQQIGEEDAASCYRAGQEAIRHLETMIKSDDIDCGFRKKSSLYMAHNAAAAKWLYTEFEIRDKHHLSVQWLDPGEIKKQYALRASGGILSNVAASMDAYKFTHEVIRKNAGRGLKVYDQVEIKRIHHSPRGITIQLHNDHTIRARKIVYCTGYETLNLLKEPLAKLYTTYACVSEEDIALEKPLHDLVVWNTQDPYLYLRTTDDNRLLVGGADTKHDPADLLNKSREKKSKLLKKQLQAVLPGVNFIDDFNWAGVFGSTKDGLPYIGAHPGFRHGYFVLGFGGNGITFSIQGMQIIADLIKGEENQLAHLYRFGR